MCRVSAGSPCVRLLSSDQLVRTHVPRLLSPLFFACTVWLRNTIALFASFNWTIGHYLFRATSASSLAYLAHRLRPRFAKYATARVKSCCIFGVRLKIALSTGCCTSLGARVQGAKDGQGGKLKFHPSPSPSSYDFIYSLE
jgi:hypothetical protein